MMFLVIGALALLTLPARSKEPRLIIEKEKGYLAFTTGEDGGPWPSFPGEGGLVGTGAHGGRAVLLPPEECSYPCRLEKAGGKGGDLAVLTGIFPSPKWYGSGWASVTSRGSRLEDSAYVLMGTDEESDFNASFGEGLSLSSPKICVVYVEGASESADWLSDVSSHLCRRKVVKVPLSIAAGFDFSKLKNGVEVDIDVTSGLKNHDLGLATLSSVAKRLRSDGHKLFKVSFWNHISPSDAQAFYADFLEMTQGSESSCSWESDLSFENMTRFQGVHKWAIGNVQGSCAFEGRDMTSGMGGFLTSSMSCTPGSKAEVCDFLVPVLPMFLPPESSEILAMRVPGGLALETGMNWGYLNSPMSPFKCGRIGDFPYLMCESYLPFSEIHSICSKDECWPISLRVTRIPVFGGTRKLMGVVRPDIRYFVGASGSTICTESPKPVICEASSEHTSHSWACSEGKCCNSVPVDLFSSGQLVQVVCGESSAVFAWDAISSADTVGKGLSSLKQIYWEGGILTKMLIFAAIFASIRVMFYVFSLVWISKMIRNVVFTLFEVFFKTGHVASKLWCSLVWWSKSYPLCEDCGADTYLVPHSAGCPPFSGNHEGLSGTDTCVYCWAQGRTAIGSRVHWLTNHLGDYLYCIAWLWPLAHFKYLRTLNAVTEVLPIRSAPQVGRRGGYRILPKNLILGLAGIALIQCVGSVELGLTRCVGSQCNVHSETVLRGLWEGDTQCYDITVPGGNPFPVCVTVKGRGMLAVGTIEECGANFIVEQFTKEYCARATTGCSYIPDMSQHEGRPLLHSSSSTWTRTPGCPDTVLNSYCSKAFAVDSTKGFDCLVNIPRSGMRFGREVCITAFGMTSCSSDSPFILGNMTVDFLIETEDESPLPEQLVFSSDGQTRKTSVPLSSFFPATKQTLLETKGILVHQECGLEHSGVSELEVRCKGKPAYSLRALPRWIDSSCSIRRFTPSDDGLSFLIEADGCMKGAFKLTMQLDGTVAPSGSMGEVTALDVGQCGGYTGISENAFCTVTPTCAGMSFCRLSKPVKMILQCGVMSQVHFTGGDAEELIFECGGRSQEIVLSLEDFGERPVQKWERPKSVHIPEAGRGPWDWIIYVLSWILGVAIIALVLFTIIWIVKTYLALKSGKSE
ncbi:glycoprotein [Actinovirus bernense]|uniref:Glycoprotein n=1 Tax=Bern perch virus TaxID=2675847 RepID=A0A6G5X106_9VIRU|nr:glycoprotein [Actinovirus bernense]QGM12350.1 glycoprotein [Actinovirus bernense]